MRAQLPASGKRLIIVVATMALLAGLAACTKQVDGTATSTPPVLTSKSDLEKRVPKPTFFGAEAEKDKTYDSSLGFYCKDKLFLDPTVGASKAEPIEFSVQQKSGDNDLGASIQQLAFVLTAFDSVQAAKAFNTEVGKDIAACPATEQIDFGGSVQNLTYVSRAYKHAGWTGTILLSKISIALKSSGNTIPGVQMSVAASKLNVQVQFNIYGTKTGDADGALQAAQSRADKLLDELAAAK